MDNIVNDYNNIIKELVDSMEQTAELLTKWDDVKKTIDEATMRCIMTELEPSFINSIQARFDKAEKVIKSIL